PEARRQWPCGGRAPQYLGIPGNLLAHFRHQSGGHPGHSRAGLSPGLLDHAPAQAARQPDPDLRPDSFLDLGAGAHRSLGGATAARRPDQQRPGRPGPDLGPPAAAVQPPGRLHRHGPHPAALHGAAPVQRHAVRAAQLPACRHFPGQPPLRRLLARVRAADLPRDRGRLAAGVHHRHRLLHHARPAGRRRRSDDQLLRRILHQPDHQLGHGQRARPDPAGGHPAALRPVPQDLRQGTGTELATAGKETMFKTELPPYLSPGERAWHYTLRILCALILLFLLLPILVIVPLSFNQSSLLLYPIQSFSLRWYETLFHSDEWARATANSFIIAPAATLLATVLGTLAAAGLHRVEFRGKGLLMAVLISPMIVPLVVT